MPNLLTSKLLTAEEIRNSPSRLDGMSEVLENDYRRKTCLFIKAAGKALDLPVDAIATALVFVQKFFMLHSFQKHERFVVGSACLFLASKVEESPKRVELIVSKCFGVWTNKEPLNESEKPFKRLREKILIAERCVLHTLGFQLSVEHPYSTVMSLLKMLFAQGRGADGGKGVDKALNRQLSQAAMSFVNDSLLTTVCLQYRPEQVAAAVVYLSYLYMGLPRVDTTILKTDEVVVAAICDTILSLYDEHGAGYATVVVNNLRDLLQKRIDAPSSSSSSSSSSPPPPPPPPPPRPPLPCSIAPAATAAAFTATAPTTSDAAAAGLTAPSPTVYALQEILRKRVNAPIEGGASAGGRGDATGGAANTAWASGVSDASGTPPPPPPPLPPPPLPVYGQASLATLLPSALPIATTMTATTATTNADMNPLAEGSTTTPNPATNPDIVPQQHSQRSSNNNNNKNNGVDGKTEDGGESGDGGVRRGSEAVADHDHKPRSPSTPTPMNSSGSWGVAEAGSESRRAVDGDPRRRRTSATGGTSGNDANGDTPPSVTSTQGSDHNKRKGEGAMSATTTTMGGRGGEEVGGDVLVVEEAEPKRQKTL